MAEPQLTATEIDDLLTVFRGGQPVAERAASVESLDLNRPAKIPKGILETLRIRHEQVTRAMNQDLRTLMRADFRLVLKSLHQERFSGFKDSLEEPCCGFAVEMAPLRAPAYIVLDFPFAYACLDRLLGGSGDPEGAGRELTPTEVTVLEDVLRAIIAAHLVVWERYLQLKGELSRPISVPRFMREMRGEDAVMVATYQVAGFAGDSRFRFMMPLPGLEPHLQYRRKVEPDQEQTAAEGRGRLLEGLRQVKVGVSVCVGHAEIPLRELLTLECRDVVLLDRALCQGMDLLVEGQPKFRGCLGLRGRNVVFQVKSGGGLGPAQGGEGQT